jgi:hypothetical protein
MTKRDPLWIVFSQQVHISALLQLADSTGTYIISASGFAMSCHCPSFFHLGELLCTFSWNTTDFIYILDAPSQSACIRSSRRSMFNNGARLNHSDWIVQPHGTKPLIPDFGTRANPFPSNIK